MRSVTIAILAVPLAFVMALEMILVWACGIVAFFVLLLATAIGWIVNGFLTLGQWLRDRLSKCRLNNVPKGKINAE